MKIRNITFALLATITFAGCADFIMAVSAPIRNMRVSVNNTMPWPVNQVGTSGTRVSIENPQPYYALIVNNGQKYPVCIIPPGGSAVDNDWQMNIPHKVLSLAAIFYADPACTQWIGMSLKILDVNVGQSSKWIINHVTYPENRYDYGDWYGTPIHPLSPLGGEQGVAIYGPAASGANYVMVGNCTYYTMIVRLDGVRVAQVPPGWVYPWYDEHMYSSTRKDFTFWFVDQSGLNYGHVDYPIDVTQYGPVAHELMITAQDIRRR